jgi:hypothetical protein
MTENVGALECREAAAVMCYLNRLLAVLASLTDLSTSARRPMRVIPPIPVKGGVELVLRGPRPGQLPETVNMIAWSPPPVDRS